MPVNGKNVISPAGRNAQVNTRASVRTLAEIASPISISARLFVGLAVLARLARIVVGGPRDQSGPKQPQQDIPPFSGRFLDLVLEGIHGTQFK